MNQASQLRIALLIAAASTGSCGHGHSHDADGHEAHAEEAEPPARQVTIWSDRHEYFAEHDLSLAGQPAGFAVHATTLSDGAAVLSGPLRMSFVRGEQRIEVSVEQPARPGIFLGEIALPEAGEWRWELELHGDAPSMPDWRIAADPAELAQISAEVSEPGGITVLKEQLWPLGALTALAQERVFTGRLPVLVRVQSPPDADLTLRAPVGGTLEAGDSAWPALGDELTAGQLLGRVRLPVVASDRAAIAAWELQREALSRESAQGRADAEADLARLAPALEQAILAEHRLVELARADSASAREQEEARVLVATLQADVAAAAARLEFWRATAADSGGPAYAGASDASWIWDLRAPIGGRVIESWVVPGSFVAAGAPLLRIHDSNRLRLVALAPLALAGRLDAATLDLMLPDGVHATLPGPFGRRILSDAPADAEARAIPIVFECAGLAGLRAGVTLSGSLAAGAARTALAVPDAALVDEDGMTVVYVQIAGEAFERRMVQVGARDGGWAEVRSGLAAGERVVSRGAYVIRLISLSGVIPEHSH